MNLRIKTDDARNAVMRTRNLLSRSDTQPLLKDFVITAKEAKVSLCATDLELCGLDTFEAIVEEEGCIAIPGERFAAIVMLLTAEHFTLKTIGVENVEIVADDYQASLRCHGAEEHPGFAVDVEGQKGIEILREDIQISIDRVRFAVASNETRRNLMVVYISGGFAQATDGHVTSIYKVPYEGEPIVIPGKSITPLLDILTASGEERITMYRTENAEVFKIGRDLFSTRVSYDRFPDIDRLVKATDGVKEKLIIERKEFSKKLERVSKTSDVIAHPIELVLEKTRLKMVSSDNLGNISTDSMPCDWSGTDGFKAVFCYDYLKKDVDALLLEKAVFFISPKIAVPVKIEEGNLSIFQMRYIEVQAPAEPEKKE